MAFYFCHFNWFDYIVKPSIPTTGFNNLFPYFCALKVSMIEKVEIGALQVEDYKELMAAMKAAYQGWQGGFWSLESIQSLIRKFPEGQIVIKSGGGGSWLCPIADSRL